MSRELFFDHRFFFLERRTEKKTMLHYELDWLAASQLRYNGEQVVFNENVSMAVYCDRYLLVAGARDYGVLVIDMSTGLITHAQPLGAHAAVAVLVDGERVFI